MPKFKQSAEAPVVVEEEKVTCRVRREGDGKISTGNHDPRGGEEVYAVGETFSLAKSIALELEGRYYVDILARGEKAA